MQQEWRVVEILDQDQRDIGELLMAEQDYLNTAIVNHHLISQGYILPSQKVTIDGDNHFLYVTEDGLPLYTLVRNDI